MFTKLSASQKLKSGKEVLFCYEKTFRRQQMSLKFLGFHSIFCSTLLYNLILKLQKFLEPMKLNKECVFVIMKFIIFFVFFVKWKHVFIKFLQSFHQSQIRPCFYYFIIKQFWAVLWSFQLILVVLCLFFLFNFLVK